MNGHAAHGQAPVTAHVAKNGLIDLSGIEVLEPIRLKGEWRFFSKQLISPEDLTQRLNDPAEFIAVPGKWNEHIVPKTGQALGALSYGTYLLRIDGLTAARKLTLNLAFVTSSYKLWVLDTQNVSHVLLSLGNGTVGTTAATSIPQYDNRLGSIEMTEVQDSVYVLIQVANFSWIHGGIFFEPSIGSLPFMQRELEEAKHINLIVLGVALILGLYNISLFAYRREDFGSLFLGIFCLGLAMIYARAVPNFLYFFADVTERNHWLFRSVYFITNPILVASFNSFICANFPKQSSKLFERLGWVWVVFISVPLIFFQKSMPSALFLSYQYMGLSQILAITIPQLIRATRHREEGALLSLVGTTVLFLSFVNDYLIMYKVREGFSVLPFGVTLFVLLQSQIVAIRFTKAFRRSEQLGRNLQQEVERQTRDIKSILKNIKQGIFTLIPPFKQAGEQYSDHLAILLGQTAIAGKTVDQLLLSRSNLDADSKSQIESALDASLGEDILGFSLNEASFVSELQFQSEHHQEPHVFEIDWNPIVNKQDIVEKILVSLRDVTDVRRLLSVAERREEDMKILIELIQIPEEKFQRFVLKTSEYISENKEIIEQKIEPRSEALRRLFMNMHTIKGAARTYALKAISNSAHTAEQYYASLLRDEDTWDGDKLMAELEEVYKVIAYYQEVGEVRLGWNSHDKIVKLSRDKLQQNLNFLLELDRKTLTLVQKNQLNLLQDCMSSVCFDSLPGIVDEAARGLESLARDLKKPIPQVKLPDSNILMKDSGSEFLFSILVHLFRNSLDHGIEPLELRQQRGKAPQGLISISTKLEIDHLVLSFTDDGNGLDLLAIRAKAEDRGLIQSGKDYSVNEIAELIFLAGFSTRNVVSEVSGRGVGLDAVRTYCQDVGASVAILVTDFSDMCRASFSYEIRVPGILYWVNEKHEGPHAAAS